MAHKPLSSMKHSTAHPATRYFLQNTSGFSFSPVGLLTIFGKLDNLCEPDETGTERARPGNHVTVYDAEQRQEFSLELVDGDDSEPEKGRISIMSPLGSALLGRERGDWAEVYLFGRTFNFEVRHIRAG